MQDHGMQKSSLDFIYKIPLEYKTVGELVFDFFSLLSLIVDTVILAIWGLLLIEALYEFLYPLMPDFKDTM